MPKYDYDVAVKGIINLMQQRARIDESKQRILEAQVINKMHSDTRQKERNSFDPFEKAAAKTYLNENPQADVSGIAPLQEVKQQMGQGGPNVTSQGVAVPSTTAPVQDRAPSGEHTVGITPRGFSQLQAEDPKTTVTRQIYEKYMQGGIESLSDGERQMIGIKAGKSSDSAKAQKEIRALAIQMATNKKRSYTPVQQYDSAEYIKNQIAPNEKEIQAEIDNARNYLYPDDKNKAETRMKQAQGDAETQDMANYIKGNFKKASEALNYLTKERGMDEEEAKSWLKMNLY